MVYTFSGIKQDSAGAYWYDDRDIPKVTVPISKTFDGNTSISLEKLEEHFKFQSDLPPIPKFLIRPRLDSSWNYKSNDGWDITGEMVVYEPLEWVPIVVSERTYPKGAFTKSFEETEVTVSENKLFGKVSSELEISGGGSFFGVKIEAKVKAEGSVEATLKTERIQKIVTEGKLGDMVVKEIWFALGLRVKQVYSRKINLWNANNGGSHEVTWYGGPGWDEIHVPSRALRGVEGLQFSDIRMTGGGASNRIYIQALPQFSGDKLEYLHLAISNVGWKDWYAYIPPNSVGDKVDRQEVIPWRQYKPTPTLMAFTEGDKVVV
ncbi:hypothetical protein ACMFMG_002445 [Clarireedia jacksonii]